MDLVNSTTILTASTPSTRFAVEPNNSYEKIVYTAFSSILACVVIVGNGFVMIAFKVNYKLRTVTNMYFVSLALCDFFVGLSIPLWIFNLFKPLSLRTYIFSSYLNIFSGAASIFHLTIISLERCFSIVTPVRHRAVPVTFYYIMVFTVWILATFILLVRLLSVYYVAHRAWCNLFIFLVTFMLPLLIMITTYALLFYTITKRTRSNVRSSENLQFSWSSRLKTIVTLLIIIGLFLITWGPFFTYTALVFFYPRPLPTSFETRTRILLFIQWMHYFNSSLNPFVYAYRIKEFKHSFKAILHACIKCKRYDDVSRELRRGNNHYLVRGHIDQVVQQEGEAVAR